MLSSSQLSLPPTPLLRYQLKAKPLPATKRDRRKTRLIEINAKCRHPKKLTCKGILRQVFYLIEVPSPPMTPILPPPLHFVYVYTVYLFTQGRGGERGLQSWVENINMTD
jgi:hypothetical protein